MIGNPRSLTEPHGTLGVQAVLRSLIHRSVLAPEGFKVRETYFLYLAMEVIIYVLKLRERVRLTVLLYSQPSRHFTSAMSKIKTLLDKLYWTPSE